MLALCSGSRSLGEPSQPSPDHIRFCELVGVSDRILRSCCAEFLGMSPIRYVLLRRLREVHSALRAEIPTR